MIINDVINVQDDRLMNGLVPMIRIMSKIEQSKDDEHVIDFSKTKFISPVFALSLLVYVSRSSRNIRLVNMNNYMKTFHVHDEIMPDKMRNSEFLAVMEGYAQKT